MPKYYETKNFLVKTLGVAILTVFMAVLFSTSKVFADEPGSVFLMFSNVFKGFSKVF